MQAAAEQRAVYDALLRAVLDAVRNLDLEYHQAQAEGAADATKLSSPDTKAALRQVCAATTRGQLATCKHMHCTVINLLGRALILLIHAALTPSLMDLSIKTCASRHQNLA